jgi:ribosomal protein L28
MNYCAICEKGTKMVGSRKKLRGNYNPVNWSRKKPNLQTVKLSQEIYSNILKSKKIKKELINKRVKICTKCLRSLQKTNK